MAHPPFRLLIVKRDGVLFEGTVEHLRVPVEDGSLGILAHHAPMVAQLAHGAIVVRRPGGEEEFFSCTGGVVHVQPDGKVCLYLDAGERAESIDIRRAMEAEKRARELIARAAADPTVNLDRAMAALHRALARQKVYRQVRTLGDEHRSV